MVRRRVSSWILMDSLGEETILDANKYSIMHRVQIHARDFRILDPLLFYPSAILGRERAIVLNLEGRMKSLSELDKLKILIHNLDLSYKHEWVGEKRVNLTQHSHELGTFQL